MLKKLNIEKIGNTLIYLANGLRGPLYLTKALKLLYLTDEHSIKETGIPFTWLDYKVWKNGPVPEKLHSELRYKLPEDCQSGFSKFINVQTVPNPVEFGQDSYIILPNAEFNDDEFSEYELELLDRILKKYGKYNATKLIDILHKEGTLWDQVVKENDLDYVFHMQSNKSEYSIPFTKLIKEDELKQLAFKSAYSSLEFSSQFE